MMNFIKKVGTALLVTSVLASCEKKITDLRPIDVIPTDIAISTVGDATNAVNGVYGTWIGRRSIYINALMSDEVRLGTGTEYRNVGNGLFNWQNVSNSQDWRDGENGGAFTNLYAVIDRANKILELLPPVVPATTAEENLKTQYRGEMLATRAFAHLELLRLYSETAAYAADKAGVVLQTEYVKVVNTYRPKRNTQGEVMTQILADLAAAKPLIPTSFVNIGRITRNAVIAMQVRAAIYTRNWQEAADRSTELIALQPITARANYAAIWTSRILAENQSSEVIWKLNITSANSGNANAAGIAAGSIFQDFGNGAVQASAAVKLVNTFDTTNDIRYRTFFRPVTNRVLVAKYGAFVTGNGENFQYDIKVLRSSEALLSRAEAYAELNNITAANADLAALRSARITGYAHTAITDKATLIAAILNERYKELCYEGHRYVDLKRRNLPIVRDAADAGGLATSVELQPTSPKYILPIPQQELFANPNYGQNPGY
jgi:hypothetical protein